MTGHRCRYCDAEIIYTGRLWLKNRVADVNGFAQTALTTCITLLMAPLSGRQVVINGHALCPPLSFLRGCDLCQPGTAVQVERRSEVTTNGLDRRRSVDLPGDGHHGHGVWLIAE